MDCKQFLEHLSDYVDGDCAQSLREAVQEHTAFCRKCDIIYNSTQRTLQIATECGLDTYTLPAPASERLHSRLRSWFLARRPLAVKS